MNFNKIVQITSVIFFAVFFANITNAEFENENLGYNEDAIQYLYAQGVVQGYPDGTFKANIDINRAEFLKIVIEASDINIEDKTHCYLDVTDEWFANYICTATDLGFIEGYPDNLFKPGERITFAEASKIVSNVMKLEQPNDDSGIWYKKYVLSLENNKAIPLSILSFGNNVDRGEMAYMIWILKTKPTITINPTYASIKYFKNDISDYRYLYYGTLPYDKLENFVQTYNIELENHQRIDNIDESILKEIKFRALVEKLNVVGSNGLADNFILKHKNIAAFVSPNLKNYFFLKTLDFDSISFINDKSFHDDINLILIKDNNGVYEITVNENDIEITKIDWLDQNTISQVYYYCLVENCQNIFIYKDANHVMSNTDTGLNIYDNIDASSFKLSTYENDEIIFFEDINNLYYLDENTGLLSKIDDIDPGTLEIINEYDGLFKDKNYVYYFNENNEFKIIPDADPETFIVEHILRFYFLHDEDNIFEFDFDKMEFYPAPDFDLSQATLLQEQKTNDYYDSEIIYSLPVYIYNNQVYSFDFKEYKLKIIENVDVDTLEPIYIDSKYSFQDKNYIYIFHTNGLYLYQLTNIDKETFGYIPGSGGSDHLIFKDKNNIYYTVIYSPNLHILEGADIDTFEIINGWNPFFAKDKNHVYQMDKDNIIYKADIFDANTFQKSKIAFYRSVSDTNGLYIEKIAATNRDMYALPDPTNDCEFVKLEGINQWNYDYKIYNYDLLIYDNDTAWIKTGWTGEIINIPDFNADTFDFEQNIEELIEKGVDVI